MQHPRDSHLIVVKRVFRYLKGTLNIGFNFVKTPHIALRGFCDADWADSKDDRCSTTGFAIYMGDNLLSWGAKKQATVSRSTAKAEYRALASTTAELMWFIHLLKASVIYFMLPHYIVTTSMLSTWLRILFSIIARNILRLMIILFGNKLLMVFFLCNISLVQLESQISLQNPYALPNFNQIEPSSSSV
jgi:hypothetical protein